MNENQKLREELRQVRELAKGAQAWREMVNPTQILDIVGREDPPAKPQIVITIYPPRPCSYPHGNGLFGYMF
jgi:hypothetical protein